MAINLFIDDVNEGSSPYIIVKYDSNSYEAKTTKDR